MSNFVKKRQMPGKARYLAVIAAFLMAAGASVPVIAADEPLVLEKSIGIPDVPLWPYADGMAIDLQGGRIFATPQGAKAVAVLDLKSGALIKMIPGIGNPHGLAYNPSVKRLFVADGATGDVKVFDGENFSLIKTIPIALGADMSAYDPVRQIFYVNNGGAAAGMHHSVVSVIDTVKMEKEADIVVPGPSLEGDYLDIDKQILYVTVDDEKNYSVAIVDLNKRETVAVWRLPAGRHRPKAIAFDAEHQRLFVATRDTPMRGSVFAFDIATGMVVNTLPIGGWTDGIAFDKKRRRLYISTGLGYVETYAVNGQDKYEKLSSVETAILAKSSLFSEELDRFYVAVPTLGSDGSSQVLVLKPTP